ncbi:hypothetical protein [Candidatus Electrothrix sp.]|uniref:hypothetical protein n=1 Tax=Candidatus Electrothrix sp. TaxID=2170559 RepID=UPI0040573E71
MKTTATASKPHMQNRIYELLKKINYAKSACDAYQEKNNYLYQTNLMYLDDLKQQLVSLRKS